MAILTVLIPSMATHFLNVVVIESASMELSISVLSVSYTHLDVYKRQDMYMVSQFPIKRRCTPVRESLDVKDIGTI